jgi:hypothetical protein
LTRFGGLNKLLIPILVATFSLLSAPGLASAEIKITAPANWQPAPTNNSTSMLWFQNSTNSIFGIYKVPIDMVFPLFIVGAGMAQSFADQEILESADQVTFGHSNFGQRYFLNVSSQSDIANASSSTVVDVKGFLDKNSDIPFKEMLIIAEKHGDLYGILLLSPRENFNSKFNEIKPSLDSIQLSNSTGML